MTTADRRFAPRQALGLALMFVFALVFWDWLFMYPLKVFVVLLHELGHATAAVLTGGSVDRIELSPQLGGVCWSRGGIRLLVLPAGYLGSMLFGGLILWIAARSQRDRFWAMGLGVFVLLVTLLLLRSLFGIVFGLLFALALIAMGRFLPDAVNDLVLRFLGLTSAMYAVIDIKEDLISRTVPGSDAYAMSQELFLPPVFWGVLWMGLALAFGAFLIWAVARSDGNKSGNS